MRLEKKSGIDKHSVEEISPEIQKKIVLSNKIALGVMVFFGIITLVGYLNFEVPIIGHLFLISTFIAFSTIIFNKFRFYNFARFLLSVYIPILLVFGGAYAKSIGITNNLILYLSPRMLITVGIIIPVLVFGYQELKKTIFALLPGIIVFILYDKIHQLFGVQISDLQFDPHYYPTFQVMIILFVGFMIANILSLQATHQEYEKKIQEKNNDLIATEEELRQQNEEILTINEHLTHSQDLIIKQKNEIEVRKNRFQDMIFLLPDMIFEATLEGEITYVNQQFFEQIHYSISDIKQGLSLYSLIKDKEQQFKLRSEISENKTVTNFELELVTKNSELLTVLVSVKKTELLRGTIIDITERKQQSLMFMKLSEAVKQSANTVLITDTKGNIEYTNPAFKRLSGYTFDEVEGKNPNIFKTKKHSQDFYKTMWNTISSGKIWKGKFYNIKKNGDHFWEQATISPIFDKNKRITNYVAIKEDISSKVESENKLKEYLKKLTEQNEIISDKNKRIVDSINYAKIIQTAVLKPEEQLSDFFKEAFIYNRPKDIVGGDFYYFQRINNKIVVVVADSTGHGVPGGFMTMLGLVFIEAVVNDADLDHPGEVLNIIREKLIKSLGQNEKDYKAKDGMDLALCVFDEDMKKMQYSGANRPLMMVRNGQIITVDADKMPIGMYHKMNDFSEQTIDLKPNDMLYLYSDGLTDQFGGERNRKYSRKRFKDLLLKMQSLPMCKQKIYIENEFFLWQGNQKQTDDMICMGLKI